MNHEYRESPYSSGVCAGCGLSFSLCQGMKAEQHLLKQIDAALDAQGHGVWDAWCRRFGIDPNTPDETVLDDYLHGRTPGARLADLPRALWLTPAARAEVHELERWFRL